MRPQSPFRSRFGRPVLLALAAALLGGAGWLLAAGAGESDARTPGAPTDPARASTVQEPTFVYECYAVLKGEDPKLKVRLRTENFGRDDVVVRESNRYCEAANKYVELDATTQPIAPEQRQAFQCFAIDKGADPDDAVVLETKNFGRHKAVVRTAVSMCETAIKYIPGKPPYGNEEFESVWQCYKLDTDVGLINKNVHVMTDNFGLQRNRVRRPALMCEPAIKYRRGWEPYGAISDGEQGVPTRILECFDVEAPFQKLDAVVATRNFGRDELQIREGKLLCEPGLKWREFDLDNEQPTVD